MGDVQPLSLQLLPEATQLNAPSACAGGATPHACDAWNARGNAAFRAERWEETLEAYSHAIALGYQYHHYIHFDCSALFAERAYLHLSAGHEEQAQRDIKEAVFQDHNNPLKDWQPGAALPDYAEADPLEENWQRHIALPTMEGRLEEGCFHPDIARYRALHHAARSAHTVAAYDAAIEVAMRFHRHYHRHAAQHHLNRGLAYFRLSAFDQSALHGEGGEEVLEAEQEANIKSLTLALNDFSKACDLDTGWADAWRCRGNVRAALGNLRDAEADYARATACA